MKLNLKAWKTEKNELKVQKWLQCWEIMLDTKLSYHSSSQLKKKPYLLSHTILNCDAFYYPYPLTICQKRVHIIFQIEMQGSQMIKNFRTEIGKQKRTPNRVI